jgi:two-component system response regulator AtoC
LREAEGGTIFLDEIGDISKNFQSNLLRVFEEREVRPIGSSKSHKIDVRIITATNKDLKQLADEGRFRSDLYYRLSVIPIHIPPLRERKEDILPLANHFISRYGKLRHGEKYTISQQVQQVLLDYSWPGNIRELQNAIKHALAMAPRATLTIEDLPVQILNGLRPDAGNWAPQKGREEPGLTASPRRKKAIGEGTLSSLSQKFVESEKDLILAALSRNQGNRTRTAQDLGISRTTLWRKIAMYQIENPGGLPI